MNKKNIITAFLSAMAATASAGDTLTVKNFAQEGPYTIQKPFIVDSLNASQKKFADDKSILYGDVMTAQFTFDTKSYINAEVKVEGAKDFKVYINEEEANGKKGLQPGQYTAKVRYVKDTTDVKLSLISDKDGATSLVAQGNGKRPFTLKDNMHLSYYSSVSVSPSGKYAFYSTGKYETNGNIKRTTHLINTQTGKEIHTISGWTRWMPKTDRYLTTRWIEGKTQLISIDPVTLDEKILCKDMPMTDFMMSPTEDFLILTKTEEGPRKEDGVYQILTMDDRQPGWRTRRQLYRYDLNTEQLQPLTYGWRSVWASDISSDGKTLYIGLSEERLTQRPTTLTSLLAMNMETLKVDTIISKDGFIGSTQNIPGTKDFLVMGSPEAFNGIGKNLPEGLTPSMYDYQLFLLKGETKEVVPLTKDFAPSLKSFITNGTDGYAYFTAECADSVNLYRLNLKNYKISLIKQPVEVIGSIDLASCSNTLLYYGNGAVTSNKLYSMNLKTMKPVLLDDINKEELKDVELGTCEAWRFKSERGYELTGHVYLPANMDRTKKYPMIVHYYGGCSPTSRRFGGGSHYPAHYWNALGYIVLIVNPSGAAGFGQEWASRHVNTAGEGPAQDIIESTKWYCNENAFVDSTKLGCISASYGGFMTQYILTKTDMFAAGVSHAGISDHSSYWGNGYWGYNYSEVSMANSYPWTRKDLFVDCSPLYNADKIHKPLLLTHGTADTNVPTMESIQMFCALKLLGRPTALILVEGENHGIMDYTKRQKWINSIVAWFDKYLKNDDSWWNAIYTPKEL